MCPICHMHGVDEVNELRVLKRIIQLFVGTVISLLILLPRTLKESIAQHEWRNAISVGALKPILLAG